MKYYDISLYIPRLPFVVYTGRGGIRGEIVGRFSERKKGKEGGRNWRKGGRARVGDGVGGFEEIGYKK